MRHRGHRRGLGSAGAAEFTRQTAREARHAGIVEHDCVRGNVLAGERPIGAVAHLHRHQRVHPQVGELRGWGRGARQSHDSLELALQKRHQHLLALGRRSAAYPGERIFQRVLSRVRAGVGRLDQVLQQRRAMREVGGECLPVDRRHHPGGEILTHEVLERPEAIGGRDPAGALRLQLACDPFALLLSLAEPRPGPPGDALAGEPLRAPVRRQLVQEGVGRGVIRLPGVAEHARHAGEQHEQVEVAIGGGAVQVPGTEHLRPQHVGELLPGLVRERAVRQHSDAVNDAPERRQRGVDPLEHGVQRRRVGHVGQLDGHRGAPFPERHDRLGGLRVGIAPPVEHDRAGAALGQPAGQDAADAAEASGD